MDAAALPRERIWYQDPAGMFAGDRIARFLPERDASLTQQLNAIARFALYYALIMFFVGRRSYAMYALLIGAAGTAVMYHAAAADERHARAGRSPHVVRRFEEGLSATPSVPSEGGLLDRHGQTCTRPTLDNPFGNVTLDDYTRDPDRPPACDLQDPGVADQVEALFEHNLYRDVGDAMHRNASSRQFYTNPVTTIPNDQGAFARWCYGTGPGCKEGNGDRCDTNTFRAIPGR